MSNAKILSLVLCGVATIGLIDSVYLSYTALTETSIKCFITHGCDTVAQSPYSKVAGIPLAVYGVIYYVGMIVISALSGFLSHKVPQALREKLPLLVFVGGCVGIGLSLYFIFVQAVLIKAMCIYCLISAFCTGALFILSAVYYRKVRPQSPVVQ
jgi:uncharacterized membrane protein